MVAVAGYEASLSEAGEAYLVVNETFAPDAGNVTTLDESNNDQYYYDENVSVYTDGSLLDAGTDYKWFTDNGTVKTLAGGSLDGKASANITYGYQQTTQTQRDLTALTGQVPRLMGFALPIGVLMFLLFLVRGS